MPPAVLLLKKRLAADPRYAMQVALLAAIHLLALGVLIWSEHAWEAQASFVLIWGFLNFLWLVILPRPITAAALSLAFIVVLVMLSQFKHGVTMTTVTFVDLMLVDLASFSFLMSVIPGLAWKVTIAAGLVLAVLAIVWRNETFAVRRSVAAAGGTFCFAALAVLSLALPADREDEFYSHQYVSKFARSAAVAAVDLAIRGVLEADAVSPQRLNVPSGRACSAGRKLPHIVMVFDESSFDASMLPNVSIPPNYRERFRSSDGKIRSFLVEGAGGPSWFTEYNVLSGLSVRSYGRFADSVTKLAAGHVRRGLPYALRNCGYQTYSLYSWFGAFAGARNFHRSTGIEHFLDSKELNSGPADTDSFYYDQATRVIARERDNGPVFAFVYLAVNHFPWNFHYRPDLLPGWINPGNPFEVDENLRRQQMSADDYALFKHRLARELAGEPILIVRFGDHQPLFAKYFIDPTLDRAEVARHVLERDPRYFTTYYAIDSVNFDLVDLSSALDPLDAPYLPLVVLESAGVPLDASFAEQKKILKRCRGMFYLCADGAEARRFNRLLIDAGLITGF